MKIVSCRFERSAFGPQDEPKGRDPQVVFLGRSNVGKSSLINRLLGVKGLARTSSQPGRTQCVNFYRVNDRLWFVDLPGYGYARVPERVRRQWGPLVEGFLERRREEIACAVLLVDSRRRPTEHDRLMAEWLDDREIDYLVAATKADKLSGNDRQRARKGLKETWPDGPPAMLVSSASGHGIKELWRGVDEALRHFGDQG